MSAEATGWVFKHSPYSGAALLVHIALADAANDLNANEIWARQQYLADKARVTRQTVNRALAQMLDDGLLLLLEDHSADGQPNRYLFVIDHTVEQVFDPQGGVARGDRGVAVDDRGVSREATPGVARGDTEPKENPRGEPKVNLSLVAADADDDLSTVVDDAVDSPTSDAAAERWGQARDLCEFFVDVIVRSSVPGTKPPTVTRAWVRDMELMLRVDKRDPEAVRRAIMWAHEGDGSHGNGNGWAGWGAVVRCPAKLRQQFDRMAQQAKNLRQRQQSSSGYSGDDFRRAAQQARLAVHA